MGAMRGAVSWKFLPGVALTFALAVWGGCVCSDAIAANTTGARPKTGDPLRSDAVLRAASELISEGRYSFRYETFGDEAFWGGTLGLHRAIAGDAEGGLGPGVSVETARAFGLKFDAEALSPALIAKFTQGRAGAGGAKEFLQLLELDAVVGLTGFFDGERRLVSVGVQCALCHSTVDDGVAPGVGHRLDGWANRDLNVGALLSLAPNLAPFTALTQADDAALRRLFRAWGPGKLDAPLVLDAQRVDLARPAPPRLIPPVFGLAGATTLQLHGRGLFVDPREREAVKLAIAADAGFTAQRLAPDLVTPRLAALHVYQVMLRPPSPLPGTVSLQAATRGKALFEGKARCARCHVPPLFSEPTRTLHAARELGFDEPDARWPTARLAGLFTHHKGGFYGDGRFPTLEAVVKHYDQALRLELSASEQVDLVAYLKSL